MKFVILILLCIWWFSGLGEASQHSSNSNFRWTSSARKKYSPYRIDDLKMRLIQDAKRGGEYIPPYIRKYNKRFKSIYESMHNNNNEREIKDKKKNVYGYFEKYQQNHQSNNEIPESDIMSEMVHKSKYRKNKYQQYHKKQHHHHHHHRNKHSNNHNTKIKKLRSKPEAGIMQKKLKT